VNRAGAASTIVPLPAGAMAGRRPTCRNLLDDLFVAAAVLAVGEDGIGTIADVAEMERFRPPR
jgi:hypothetical protein